MKRIGKVLAFALAAVLVIGVLPGGVLAAEPVWQTVSGGSFHSLAIKADGSLWAWGANDFGQIGDGTTGELHYAPAKIMDGVASVAAGGFHSLAVKTDGSLWAWGRNVAGQLGDGTKIPRFTPVKIMDGVASVAAGENHSFAVKTDGSLWAWGNNYEGQLGDGTTDFHDTPVKITDGVASVAAGVRSLAIKTDGSLWAWGGAIDGVYDIIHYTPVKIMDGVVSVTAGQTYFLVVKADGSLWAWGSNSVGQLGDPTVDAYNTLVKIMDSDFVAIAAGGGHSLAIKADGSLWAWGSNYYGEVGDGTTDDRHTPVKIMDGVASVAAGVIHSLAIKTDGSLWAWGDNTAGGLGDGTTTDRYTPVKIMDGDTSTPTPAPAVDAVELLYTRTLIAAYTDETTGTDKITGIEGICLSVNDNGEKLSQSDISNLVFYKGEQQIPCSISRIEITNAPNSSGMEVRVYFQTAIEPTPGKYYATFQYRGQYYQSNALICHEGNTFEIDMTNFKKISAPTVTPPAETLIAKPTASTVLVNGQSVAFDAYNINGNNYFKLRDLAYILSGTEKQFEVSWDSANNAISLTSGKSYTAVGGEMTGKGAGNKTPTATTSKILLDGKGVSFTAYNIEGSNYFKLRDIGDAFDFGVTWDGANNAIVIDTSVGYTPE